MKIYEEQMLDAVEDRAYELAQEFNASSEITRQAVWSGIIDLLVTQDSELNEKIKKDLEWRLTKLRRGFSK